MPQNGNQKKTITNEPNDTQNTEAPKESAPHLTKSSLNNALIRTFRGDLTKSGAQGSRLAEVLTSQNGSRKQKSVTGSGIKKETLRNQAVVHTFKDDIQHLVRNRKASLTHIAALESDRRGKGESTDVEEAIKSKKTLVVVTLTILIMVILAVFSLGAYYAYQLNTAPPPTEQLDPSFIFIEARERVDLTEKSARNVVELLASIRRNTFYSLGSMVELYIIRTENVTEEEKKQVHVTALDFLQSIEAHVPASFLQTLGNDYIVGIHTLDTNIPFILLTTQSYGHAFSGMLEWEKNIEENLLPFFSPNSEFIKPAIAAGSNIFKDEIINNLDVRILRDTDGVTRVIYAFVDRSTILITTDVRTLKELSSRARIK